MKKILGALLAGALAFTLMGCPGSTDSTTDTPTPTPSTFDGYWSYAVFTLDAADDVLTDTEFNVSFGSGSPQSGGMGYDENKGFIPEIKAGGVYYVEWDGVDHSKPAISARTDKPTLATYEVTLEADEFAIFVYTTKKKANIYLGDDFGVWPGVTTTPTVQITELKEYVDKIVFTGYEMTGTGLYFLEAWVPGNEWNENSPNVVDSPDADGNYVITFSTPAEFTVVEGDEMSVKIQIIDFIDDTNFWADGNKADSGTTATVIPDANGKHYELWVEYKATEDNVATLELVDAE